MVVLVFPFLCPRVFGFSLSATQRLRPKPTRQMISITVGNILVSHVLFPQAVMSADTYQLSPYQADSGDRVVLNTSGSIRHLSDTSQDKVYWKKVHSSPSISLV
jgi:hypothetical protein